MRFDHGQVREDLGTIADAARTPAPVTYVNEARTLLVEHFHDGTMSVATREHPDARWSPPVTVTRESA